MSAKIALIRLRTEVACDRIDALAVQASDLVAKYADSFPSAFSSRRDRRFVDRMPKEASPSTEQEV